MSKQQAAPPAATGTFERNLSRFAAFEVAAADIAMHRTSRAELRRTARALSTHGKTVLAGIRATAIERGGRAPVYHLGQAQKAALDHLRKLREPYFSVHYVQKMIEQLQLARRLVSAYALSGGEGAERRFAKSILPRIRLHLRQLQELDGTRANP